MDNPGTNLLILAMGEPERTLLSVIQKQRRIWRRYKCLRTGAGSRTSTLNPGGWEVYLGVFPIFTERRRISNDSGCQALWRTDGKELFYLTLDGRLKVVDVKAWGKVRGRRAKGLISNPFHVDARAHQYCITGHGKRILLGELVEEPAKPQNGRL